MSISPTSGYVQDAIPFGITLYNGQADSLDVTSISVKFSWDSTTWNWGTMTLPGYTSDTNTYSEILPGSAGSYTVSITVSGQAVGDWFSSSCGPFTGTLLVNPYTPSSVVVTANPNQGSAPLTVSFTATVSNGASPFTYSWTFGDGASGSGSYASHLYSSPGTFSAQVVVTDGRGRSASDSVTITVRQADTDGDGVPDTGDNCPSASNSNQADADGDGIGDVCDSTPNGGGGGFSGASSLLPYAAIFFVIVAIVVAALIGLRRKGQRGAVVPYSPPQYPYQPPYQPPSNQGPGGPQSPPPGSAQP